MTFEEYLNYFEDVLLNTSLYPVYADAEYYSYTKLNWSRTSRWLKKMEVSADLRTLIAAIDKPQHWILITEPWCGDAAHSVPQIYAIVKDNPHITLDIQLRDAEPFLIDSYLTNGGKSIPKLIIRDVEGKDLAVWGPRPEVLQALFLKLKAEGKEFSEIKEFIQKWYNEDKGVELQRELKQLLS